MRRRPLSETALGWIPLLCALCCLGAAAESGSGPRIDLAAPVTLPRWAYPKKPEFPLTKDPEQLLTGASNSVARSQTAVSRLGYAIKTQAKSPNLPYWRLCYGRLLADLNQDAAAYQALQTVRELGPRTLYTDAAAVPTLDALRREAEYLQARVLARNGFSAETRALLGSFSPATGYELLRVAEAHALLGESEAAAELLARAAEKADGHPDADFSRPLILLRAATLAYLMEQRELALRLTREIRAGQPRLGQTPPQWLAAVGLAERIEELATAEAPVAIGRIREGTTAGTAPGFDYMLEVRIRGKDGALADLRVARDRETGPWAALRSVPYRVLQRKSLVVDAVTGATVTSCAILLAASDALSQAGER